MVNETVEISLPRHVAVWLLVHCDRHLAQLGKYLSCCATSDEREWALSEMKLFNLVFGRLNHCVSKREIVAFINK